MKKIFSFTNKKKTQSGTPDSGSALSAGYELKEKDLGKIHKAAFNGDLTKLKQLAKKNDISQLDKENRTPLHLACANGHAEMVQFLVDSKAKLNLCDNQNRSALMKAVQGQHEQCVSILLENHAETTLVDINGNTALHLAANIPSISTAALLLQHGAEINAQNKEGFTPLTVAVREDHMDMAEFLLKESACVDAVDQDQRSLLMLAAGNEQINMVKLLLRFDADITLRDAKGWSADDYAAMYGHHLCSHLIIEHSTQKADRASGSHQGLSKKKKILGSSSHDVEAGFSLGGPAMDKEDLENSSQSESVSRVSKSAADEWPSSEDENESVSNEKKPLKLNLSRMFECKKGEASTLPDSSSNGTESEAEHESRVQRSPPIPKVSTCSNPVDSPGVSSFPKAPQMTSTHLSNHTKNEDFLEDEDDREEEQVEEEEEGDMSDENNQFECSGESPEATSPVPEAKEKKRDFLSELGLKRDEEETESWDSESISENCNMLQKENQDFHTPNQQEMSSTDAPPKEPGNNSKDNDEGESVGEDDALQKENDKAKWETLVVLGKLEGTILKTKDLMDDLELGDVDDLEDASDWDVASTTSKRTLPEHRIISHGLKEFPEHSYVPGNEQEGDDAPAGLSTPQKRSSSSDKILLSTPSKSAPHPQPQTKKMVLQKQNSDKASSWETDKVASLCKTSDDNQQQSIPESQAMVETGSPEHLLMAKYAISNLEFGVSQQQKVGKETANSETRDQKPSSLDGYGSAVEEVGCKKAGSGCLLNKHAGIHQEKLPAAAQRLTNAELQKNENPEETNLEEDFDELTQSSDTATDDTDSPISGYRHASLLIQKMDSSTWDTTTTAKLQNIFHEYERSIRKEMSQREYLTDKVKQLEMERTELKSSLEEIKDAKALLEHNQLELQTEITNLKFQLKQEQENHHNATMMYNTTRDKLRRMEEQHQLEVQERQKVEVTLRNLELEMRTLICNMKQLEDDHGETQRLLAQERSARVLQENLLSNHLRKQQEMEAENKRNMNKSNEALSQLTEASEREKELYYQNAALQEQLTVLRANLEQLQANVSLKERHLLEENEVLKEQLEDARRDLKLSEDTVTQTVFSYNNQLSTLKSELAVTKSQLESERQACEALETDLKSTQSRLLGAVKEADLRLTAHSNTEKALLREKEEHQRLKDRLTGELANQREAASNMSQKLAKAEARANSMENEVHRVTLQLTEKGLLLDILQREKDQAATHMKEMETALRAEMESVCRASTRQEAAQERLAQAQSEAILLRQQLEEAQNKGAAKERAVADAQERFSDILSKLRSDSEERVQLIEDRNKELASKAADLRDQIYKLEEEKNERETSLRQLQQEVADSLKKLSMSEASLEVNTRYRSDLEEEKTRLHKDIDRLKKKLEESEDQYVQAERHMNSLKSSLDDREKELNTAAQKLQEVLSASAASELTIRQLEAAVQKLEIENARLEAAAKQHSNKIDALQKKAQEAVMVRGHMEELVTNLQSSKMILEEQLNREVQKQSMLSHTAQDSQALWEEELKSRSKLGLCLAELEKEKGALTTQMEIEKKKAKKISEQKKSIDARLDQEMKRNAELQKEMYRLRTLLKTAKKKLQNQEGGGAQFASPMSGLRMDLGRQRHTQVGDLQKQLGTETYCHSQLEKTNEELKVQIASLKSLSQNSDHLERSKRKLEEEVLDLRLRLNATQVEQSQVENHCHEAEEKARQEIQQKLEQVNLFLQSQAASQEALDQIKAANEASLRSQLEQRIQELEGDLGRARTTQQDSQNQKDSIRTELERYQQLYTEEMNLRKSLSAKLERANSRLTEAYSKLLSEHSRSFITNRSFLGPSLDLVSLDSPENYGATLGPSNRSFSLGLSLLSSAADRQNSRVEDYLAKMQRVLDRNISKELSSATAELDAASVRLSPVGSASRVELDPVSRATQQYLEVLKKNNRI